MNIQIEAEEVQDDLNSIKSHLSHITEHGTAQVIGTLVDSIQEKLDKAIEIRIACDQIEEKLANAREREDYDEVIDMIDDAKAKYGRCAQFVRVESKAFTLRSLATEVSE